MNVLPIRRRQLTRLLMLEPCVFLFELSPFGELFFPLAFQFAGNQPVVRVHGVVLPFRPARLILIGASGSGKSVIGRRTCERLKRWSLLDTDDVIRAEFGVDRVKVIFDELGEPAFRQAELRIAQGLDRGPDHVVVATGGGLPAVADSMSCLLASGLTVFLRASVEILWRRICADEVKRLDLPMLEAGGITRLAELMEQRQSIYERAHLTIDTDALKVDEVVDTLCSVAEGVLAKELPD